MAPDRAIALSFVVPVFDEAESLPLLHAELVALDAVLAQDWEVLYVDDGSRDGTAAVVATLSATDARVRYLRHDRNLGQSAALATGFRRARGQVIVTLDADLQNDPADVPGLLAALTSDFAAVVGIRRDRRDSWARRIASRVANRVRDAVIHDGIVDTGCSLKVMRRSYLLEIPTFRGFHRFLPALIQMQGGRVAQLPVNHRSRRFGTAKYSIAGRALVATTDLFGVRWLASRAIPAHHTDEIPS
jgi:dolichol-phosphate mannosyltransferase